MSHDKLSNRNITQFPNSKVKTIVRVFKNRDFVQISHKPLYDKNLSLKAKGLLALMLSMSDEWEFRREHLLTLCSDGRDSLRAGLKELEDRGYVTLGTERDHNGRIVKWNMCVYEDPTTVYRESLPEADFPPTVYRESLPEAENPLLDKPLAPQGIEGVLPEAGFPDLVNPPQTILINNNINNNNNKVVVVESMINELKMFVDCEELLLRHKIEGWLVKYEEGYIFEKIALLKITSRVADPLKWLSSAIRDDYKAKTKENITRLSDDVLSKRKDESQMRTKLINFDEKEIETEGVRRLKARGIIDPRLNASTDFDAVRDYEEILANEKNILKAIRSKSYTITNSDNGIS